MGGGARMINWPEGFCAELVSRGVQVIRFDHRDTGLSLTRQRRPRPRPAGRTGRGLLMGVPHTAGLAADTVGLLDVLGFGRAHIVGASRGGMVAQTVAIEYPGRVRSLMSRMSTTEDRSAGQPNLAA